jgi:hypothetical protein
MVSLSDLDTSSESEYDSSQDSTSEMDEDSDDETLEPKRDAPWDPTAQLHAAQLHAKIKAQAELPIPTYLKLL